MDRAADGGMSARDEQVQMKRHRRIGSAGDSQKDGWVDSARLSSLVPGVPMMQSAESRLRNHGRGGRGLLVDGPARRSVLLQGIMNSVSMIVGDIIPHQPPKMIFVDRNHVIQKIPATTSNPAFRHKTEQKSEHERTSVAHRGVVDFVDILASRRNGILQAATGCLNLIET